MEQLPIVLRALSPAYLQNDFFTNAGTAYGPRTFFAGLVSLLAGTEAGIVPVYFVLTLLSNTLIGLVTFGFTHDVFDEHDLAAYAAVGGVLSLKSFFLGGENTLFRTYLEPGLLAMPLLLVAIWAGLRQRPALSALAAGVAALIHPLMGLETGAILLGAGFIQAVAYRTKKGGEKREGLAPQSGEKSPVSQGYLLMLPERRILIHYLAGGSILVVFGALVLLPYLHSDRISDAKFIEILAYLRHPHHYLPSTFGLLQYAQAAAFLLAGGVAWHGSRQQFSNLRSITAPIFTLLGILVLLCLGGYLFVEMFPSRLWTTAQTFRLLFIAKWLGLVLTCAWVALRLAARESWLAKSGLWLSLMSPPTLALALTWDTFVKPGLVNRVGTGRRSASWERTTEIALLLVVAAGLVIYGVDTRVPVLFTLFSLVVMIQYRLRWQWAGLLIQAALTAVILVGLVWGNSFLPSSILNLVDRPVFNLAEQTSDFEDVAAYALAHTPEDSIFLVPPKLGGFRLTARRAIVVDFKAFPFQDGAMAAWQQRLVDCCGMPGRGGWDAEVDMTNEYRRIDDEKLRWLKQQYACNYALLFLDTETRFPVLFMGKAYKLVKLE